MKLIGNILWLIFGGLFEAIAWAVIGIFWYITIIGIPIGVQCMKFSALSQLPFGKTIEYGGSAGSFLLNVLWFLFIGIEMALFNFIMGCVLCVTIIGIPFGLQYFKLAKLTLAPFGAKIA